MKKDLHAFEKTIGITFKNISLLQEAVTHRSYLNEEPNWPVPHNERLEYLGDAVLELVVSEELFKRFPDAPEGTMTVLRAALVNYQMLGRIASEIGVQDFILLSRGEGKDEGKGKEVILANTIEAIIGAIYLDRGFQAASAFVNKCIMKHLEEILENKSYKDAKSELQEIVQERLKITPTYRVLEESGPAHRRFFRVGVYFGEECMAEGYGNSKQEAETEAAKRAVHEAKRS